MQRPDLVLAIFDLSTWHILVILLVALLLFGRRLPEIMRGLGSSVKEFKKGMEEPAPSAPAPPPPPSGAVARESAPAPAPAPAAAPPAQTPPKA